MSLHYSATGFHAARLRQIVASSGAGMAVVREDYDTLASRAHSADLWVATVLDEIRAMRPVPLRALNAVEAFRPGAIASAWHDRPDYPMPHGFVVKQSKET